MRPMMLGSIPGCTKPRTRHILRGGSQHIQEKQACYPKMLLRLKSGKGESKPAEGRKRNFTDEEVQMACISGD